MTTFATGGRTLNVPRISADHSSQNFKAKAFIRLTLNKYKMLLGLGCVIIFIGTCKAFDLIPVDVSYFVSSSFEKIVTTKDTGFLPNKNAIAVFTNIYSLLFILLATVFLSAMFTINASTIKNKMTFILTSISLIFASVIALSCALEISKQEVSSPSFNDWMIERYGFEPNEHTAIKTTSDLSDGTLQKDKTTNAVAEIRQIADRYYLYNPLTGEELPTK